MLTKYLILGLYFLILFLIGIMASKKIKGLKDFYVGGKQLGYWVVAFSARATGESAWLLLGLTGMGALMGFSAFWVVVGELIGVWVAWFLMAKRFKALSDKYQSITIPDYLVSRFKASSNTLRIIAATCLSVFVIIYVSAQIDATGKAFNSFLDWDYYTGAIAGFFIVLAYIFTGGFVAVAWSDLFQGLLMLLGLVMLPVAGFMLLGDGPGLVDGLKAIDPALVTLTGNISPDWLTVLGIVGLTMIGLGFMGSPQIFVRFMSIKDENEIRKGRWVAMLFTLLTDSAAVLIGILGRYFFTKTNQDPITVLNTGGEDVLIMMAEHVFPTIIVGLYIAVVLSAIMSTIDSLLVVASSAVTRDFYQQIFKPSSKDRNLTNFSRKVTVAMALAALAIAFSVAYFNEQRTVFWFVIFGWSGIAATFCPVMILSLFWKKYTEYGAIASMITGFLCVPLFKFVVPKIGGMAPIIDKLDVLFPSFLLAMLAGFIVSKLKPDKKLESLMENEW